MTTVSGNNHESALAKANGHRLAALAPRTKEEKETHRIRVTGPVARLGFPLMIRVCTLVIGLGTTAGSAVEMFRRRVVCEARTDKLGGVAVLLIDGDTPDAIDMKHFVHVIDGSRGVFGFGLNPAAGGIDVAHKNAPQIGAAITSKMEQFLRGGGALIPIVQPHRLVRVGVVSGPGGVSSSIGTIIDSLVLQAAKSLGIEGVYLDPFLIGPDICTNATDRKIARYQRGFIKSNFSQTLQRRLEQFAEVQQPGQRDRNDAERSLAIMDQTNLAGVSIPTASEFISLVGDCLFHRYVTKAGKDADSRRIDAEGTGQHHGPISNS